jgi:hypothetical protein
MAGARPTRNHHEEAGPEVDRTDQPTRQPSTKHRDDVPALPSLSRPGRARRVTARAITQARSTLATAERQILRARGLQRWRLTMRIDDARAVLRAGGLA